MNGSKRLHFIHVFVCVALIALAQARDSRALDNGPRPDAADGLEQLEQVCLQRQ